MTSAVLLARNRSKSVTNVLMCSEFEDDNDVLLPGEIPVNRSTGKNTMEKWRSNIMLVGRRTSNDQYTNTNETRQSRSDSVYTKPPTQPRNRRQSIAEIMRKPTGLKDDIKRLWDRRPSLNTLKTQLKEKMKSTENISNLENDNHITDNNNMPIPSFFIVDRSAWNIKPTYQMEEKA